MKPNFIDPSMTHTKESLMDMKQKITKLYNSILPYAQALVEDAIGNDMGKNTVAKLSKNFALAAAGFWLDLDIKEQECAISSDMANNSLQNKLINDFGLIASNFYVTNEKARTLLIHLYEKNSEN
jgi:hypothetical protein